MRRELAGEKDGRGAICAADDADGRGLALGKAERHGREEGERDGILGLVPPQEKRAGGRFLQVETLLIIGLGVVAFAVATVCGLLCAQIMNLIPGWSKNPVNPLIGSAGVSAVPMAARVSHNVGQQADRTNFLLMHAMGPNVAGVIGTAVIAGYYITTLSGH